MCAFLYFLAPFSDESVFSSLILLEEIHRGFILLTLNTIYSTAKLKTHPFKFRIGGLAQACRSLLISSVWNAVREEAAFVWLSFKLANKLLLAFLVRGHNEEKRRGFIKSFGTDFNAVRVTDG